MGTFRPKGWGGWAGLGQCPHGSTSAVPASFSPSHTTTELFKGLFGFVTLFLNGQVFHMQVFEYFLLGHGWSLKGPDGQLDLRYF